MKLFIAEKPELARAIASAYSENGHVYTESDTKGKSFLNVRDGVIVTWCYGHMLELKKPDDYNQKFKKWNQSDLPYTDLLKGELKVSEGKERQYNAIMEKAKKADLIIHAGDPDGEGQRIIDELLEFGEIKKPVKRVLINDLNIEIVKKSLENMKDNEDFKNLSISAYARSLADLYLGINLTVGYSLKHGELLTVGRVISPILSLVVQRSELHFNHIPKDYYALKAVFDFKGEKLKSTYLIPNDVKEEGILLDKSIVEKVSSDINNQEGEVISYKKEVKKTPPPLPFNLLKLQIESFKKFNYSPDEVDEVTQNLRGTHQLITYNRSDSQYLNDEHHNDADIVIEAINENLGYSYPVNSKIKSRAFNASKVTAHHAIIPTLKKIDINNLSEKEKNIYELISKRYLAQFIEQRETEHLSIKIECNGHYFTSTAIKELKKGWRILIDEEENKKEDQIEIAVDIEEGSKGELISSEIESKKTKPLPLYDNGSLLEDIMQISKYVKNEELKKVLLERDKDKEGEKGGIGTPATRSAILKNLFTRDYLTRNKKHIIPTENGKKFFNLMPDSIKYADLTAEWQMKLNEIEDGSLSLDEFLIFIKNKITIEMETLDQMESLIQGYPCECSGTVTKRNGKFGEYWSCSNWKDCNIKYEEVEGKPSVVQGHSCKCGGTVTKRNGQYGEYWSCSNWKDCNIKYEEVEGNPSVVQGHSCECGGTITKRNGQYGEYWSCSNWKVCKLKYEDKENKPVLKG